MNNLKEQIKLQLKKIVKENEEYGGNYMFFSNLEQIKRQCDLLLNVDKSLIEGLLDNGHDWADDHISSAKENMDQVFDFIMNEEKGGHKQDVDEMKNPCWKGYNMVGTKIKNGKEVPNCVPIKK